MRTSWARSCRSSFVAAIKIRNLFGPELPAAVGFSPCNPAIFVVWLLTDRRLVDKRLVTKRQADLPNFFVDPRTVAFIRLVAVAGGSQAETARRLDITPRASS